MSIDFKLNQNNLSKRKFIGIIFLVFCLLGVLVAMMGLISLLIQVILQGYEWVTPNLIFNYPSRHPEQAGLWAALIGTLYMMGLTALITVPMGVGAAIYLEEYAPKNWITSFIEINTSNLAGIPSIVYGLLGLSIFVYFLKLERSILAGSLTMSLLILPVLILASREAIKAVPNAHREAAFALGGDKWQVVKMAVLPTAFPGILTGVILALSRAIGEAAPMVAITALVYITFIPVTPMDRFTVMPIQIFNWISRPQDDFRGLAAGGIIVLLILLLSMNSIAVILRNKFQKRSEE
jgi:phosphate transport system permease protein